jgi:hypothetical protein
MQIRGEYHAEWDIAGRKVRYGRLIAGLVIGRF